MMQGLGVVVAAQQFIAIAGSKDFGGVQSPKPLIRKSQLGIPVAPNSCAVEAPYETTPRYCKVLTSRNPIHCYLNPFICSV